MPDWRRSLTICTVFKYISSPYDDDDARGSIVEPSKLSWLSFNGLATGGTSNILSKRHFDITTNTAVKVAENRIYSHTPNLKALLT